jgi:N-acetyl-beta-hexosaminidase
MAKKEIKKEELIEKNDVKEEKVEKVEVKEAPKTPKKPKNNKVIQIIGIVVILAVVLGIVLFLTKDARLSDEEKLEKSLTTMGEEFYTDFYYTEISKNKTSQEVSEFLAKFQDVGIKVNLDNLSRYNDGANEDEIANFKNGDTECDKTNTRAVIYPKSPYGKNDYTIKAELDCGFDSAEE